MSSCLNNALLCGLISLPVQGTNIRIINIKEPDEIIDGYNDEYKIKMNKLVDDYLLQQQIMITPSGLIIENPFTDNSKKFASHFVEKLNNNEFEKDTCPQIRKGFIPTADCIEEELKKYNELLNTGILEGKKLKLKR